MRNGNSSPNRVISARGPGRRLRAWIVGYLGIAGASAVRAYRCRTESGEVREEERFRLSHADSVGPSQVASGNQTGLQAGGGGFESRTLHDKKRPICRSFLAAGVRVDNSGASRVRADLSIGVGWESNEVGSGRVVDRSQVTAKREPALQAGGRRSGERAQAVAYRVSMSQPWCEERLPASVNSSRPGFRAIGDLGHPGGCIGIPLFRPRSETPSVAVIRHRQLAQRRHR